MVIHTAPVLALGEIERNGSKEKAGCNREMLSGVQITKHMLLQPYWVVERAVRVRRLEH